MTATLPFLVEAQDAVEHYHKAASLTDAERAYVVRVLVAEGYSNQKIQKELGIGKPYQVTHLKRAGCALSDAQLSLWHKNSLVISLGHVRAIAKMPPAQIEEMLRTILAKRLSVRQVETMMRLGPESGDSDLHVYETAAAEALGRPVKIQFEPVRQSGTVTLSFYGLNDLDAVMRKLGFQPEIEE